MCYQIRCILSQAIPFISNQVLYLLQVLSTGHMASGSWDAVMIKPASQVSGTTQGNDRERLEENTKKNTTIKCDPRYQGGRNGILWEPGARASNSAWKELGRALRRRKSVIQVLNEGLKLREVERDVPGSTNTVGKGNEAQNNMVSSWTPTHLL